MHDTIQFRRKTYRVGGEDLEPLPVPAWLPTVLPVGWEELPAHPLVGREYQRIYAKHGTTRVILTCARYGDAKAWLHVSVSRKNHEIPTWTVMREVKELFIGPERTAYQVMPPRSKHVNIHAGCLHLWTCIDQDAYLPDFTAGGDTL